MWAWEQAGWDPWSAGHTVVEPATFARTGPGKALDGKPKFDLEQFDDEYFARLRYRVRAAQDRGLYPAVMLFEGWGLQRIPDAWPNHPFHPKNNVNGIDGDANGDGQTVNTIGDATSAGHVIACIVEGVGPRREYERGCPGPGEASHQQHHRRDDQRRNHRLPIPCSARMRVSIASIISASSRIRSIPRFSISQTGRRA